MPNLIEAFTGVLRDHAAEERCAHVELRSRDDRYSDVRLLFADRSWLESPAGQRLVDAFQAHPAVESAQQRKSALSLRLSDGFLAGLEHRLATGEDHGLESGDLLAGACEMVGFVGPNTNKALHVGHLRNIVLGEALASALDAAGAKVLRHSLVGDIGRRVCEALAGFESRHPGEEPGSVGLKPDHFVNLCYRDYVQQLGSNPLAEVEPADANREERGVRGDRADQLMEAWRQGASGTLHLWLRLRGWSMEGHRQTLARLGVHLDRVDFESGGIHGALAMVEQGLREGTLSRGPGEMVVFQPGRSEYSTMILLREDGFPTEHARLLAVYDHLLDDLYPRYRYVEIAGAEWQPSAMVLRDLLARLRPGPRNGRHTRIFHGLLTTSDDEKISSSSGDPLLIDDLLDEVEASPQVTQLDALSAPRVGRAAIADLAVRGFFLWPAASRPMIFSRERMFDGRQNPGWLLARAWCRARRTFPDGASPVTNPAPGERLVLVQSQGFRQALCQATVQLDVMPLMRFLRNFSEHYLAAPSSPVLDRAAEAVLRRGLQSVGFLAGRE